jgi:alpha-beta hydrolase superfamily lysophospholipase
MTQPMTHTEGTFTGASGHEIYWQAWDPESPRGLVVLVHGVHEHSGRYAHVAERLNRAGYAVHTLDHEGHGRSGGTRGNIGSMKGLLADLQHVREQAVAEHPGLPLFVVGHSMGGLVALDHLVSHGQEGVAGLVVSAPAVDA